MILRLLIITGSILFLYRRVFGYGLCIDDQALYYKSHIYDKVGKEIGSTATGKWWVDFYHEFTNKKLYNLKLNHAIQVTAHIINSCLVYLVFGANDVSFLAGVLFGLNPFNSQGAAWMAAKPYTITTILILIGFGIKWLFPFTYATSFMFATNGFLAPLLFIFNKPHWFILALPLYVLIMQKKYKPGLSHRINMGTPIMTKFYLKKIIVAFKTLGYYFINGLFPIKTGFVHSYLATFGFFTEESRPHLKPDKYMFIGIGVLYITLCNLWNTGLTWYAVFIFQWLNLLIVSHCITERYTYIANCGLMVFFAGMIMAIPFPYNLMAGTFMVGWYALVLWKSLPSYKNHLEMMKQNTINFPEAVEAWNEYGRELAHSGHVNTAIEAFMDGLKYRPHDFKINFNLAELYTQIGQYEMGGLYASRAWDALDLNAFIQGNEWMDKVKALKDKCAYEMQKKVLVRDIKIPKVRITEDGVYTGR